MPGRCRRLLNGLGRYGFVGRMVEQAPCLRLKGFARESSTPPRSSGIDDSWVE